MQPIYIMLITLQVLEVHFFILIPASTSGLPTLGIEYFLLDHESRLRRRKHKRASIKINQMQGRRMEHQARCSTTDRQRASI